MKIVNEHSVQLLKTRCHSTILAAESEKSSSVSKEEMQQVVNERDQALEDLQSVEAAFSDLHRRYEKTKTVVESFKKVKLATKLLVSKIFVLFYC